MNLTAQQAGQRRTAAAIGNWLISIPYGLSAIRLQDGAARQSLPSRTAGVFAAPRQADQFSDGIGLNRRMQGQHFPSSTRALQQARMFPHYNRRSCEPEAQ